MIQRMRMVFNSFLGYVDPATGRLIEFSSKKWWFQVASMIIYLLPQIGLVIVVWGGYMTVKEVATNLMPLWFDFYKIVFPATIGVYVYGKRVELQSANGNGTQIEETNPAGSVPTNVP